MKTTNPPKQIAIFRPGKFPATSGDVFEFSEADVQASADAYDPALHEAPLVIGHPAADGPAYGWAAGLQFADGLLQARPRDIQPEFADWVGRKIYKKISAAFYPPNHPSNPVPGVYYLRHIGFLGAQPPAVKGLPDPVFGDGMTDLLTIEFSEGNVAATTKTEEELELDRRKAELEKQRLEFAEADAKLIAKATDLALREAKLAEAEKAAQMTQLAEFAEAQVKAGKLLPKDKAGAIGFMGQLSQVAVIEFSEGDEKKTVPALTWFQTFIAGLPKAIEFGEHTPAAGGDGQQLTEEQVARKARIYHEKMTASGVNLSFAEAVNGILAGES